MSRGVRGAAPRPLRTNALGPAWASRLVPWVVVVPLVVALVLMMGSAAATMRLVAAIGVVATIVILLFPVLTALAPANMAWSKRTIVVTPDMLAAGIPEREPFEVGTREIGSAVTGTLVLGIPLPPTFQLLTEFRHIDGHRLPELTLQHYSYRYGVRLTDVNPDGVAVLAALLDGPASNRLDLASRSLVKLVLGEPDERLPDGARDALRSGRLHQARRRLARAARRTEHVSHELVMLDYLLVRRGLSTARKAFEENGRDPLVRYYLAHALLASIPTSPEHRELVVASRSRRRAEAIRLLRSLRRSRVWGARAKLDLDAVGARPPQPPRGKAGLRRVLQYRARRASAARARRTGASRRR